MNNPNFILGLDVSTSVIGMSVFKQDNDSLEIIISESLELKNKETNKLKGLEALLIKNNIFEDKLKQYVALINLTYNDKITRVILEEPLFSSNNALTCGILLKFNGIISSTIHKTIGVVAEYISSYDARMFAFPELCAINVFNKKGEKRTVKELTKSLKEGKLPLFGNFAFGISKKDVIFDLIIEQYPNINVLLDKKGEIRKINYDASDSIACVLGKLNMDKCNGEKPKLLSYDIQCDKILYKTKWLNNIYEHIIVI
jgi:Holliday junction resolvasome RuvABC endonuclease subunit